MQQPARRNSTAREKAATPTLDQFLARVMREPTLELRQFVELIAAEIGKRLRPSNEPPLPTPGELAKLLKGIEKDWRSLIKHLSALEMLLGPHPDLYRRIFYWQFGLLSGVSEVHLADRSKASRLEAERTQEPHRREEEDTRPTEQKEKWREAWVAEAERQRAWVPPEEWSRSDAHNQREADESYIQFAKQNVLREGIKPRDYNIRDLSLDGLDQTLSIERLGQALRHTTWQREHYTLEEARPDPAADRLCAVAVVNLAEMTRWQEPANDAVWAWEWCEDLLRLAGAPASPGDDPLSRWRGHLAWALEEKERRVQRHEAEAIVLDACQRSGFIALSVPEN